MRAIRFSRDFLRRVKWRVTLVLAVAAVAAVALYAALDARRQEGGTPGISVVRGGHIAARIERDELARLGAARVEYGGGTYGGVPLAALLEHAEALPTIYETVHLRGKPAAVMTLPGAAVIEGGGVYILFEKDGQAIPSREGGPFIAVYGESAALTGLATVTVDLME